jgi:hypothetical protein
MNTPIIRPSLIYLINLAGGMKTALIVITVIAVIVAITASSCISISCCLDDPSESTWKKLFKISVISGICCTLAYVAIPSEKTCYTMLVGSQLTPQNIQSVGNDLKSAVDYIFEKIDELEE